MVKEIVKDRDILHELCEPVDNDTDYKQILKDLFDTAHYHIERCAGLAANQIGVLKRVIIYRQGIKFKGMVNPKIVKHSKETKVCQEGCLSLDYTSTVTRYKTIMVLYQDENGKSQCKSFSGFVAQEIQHEIDHLNGILI